MSHALSPEGLALVKRLEGFRAEPTALPQGGYVVGYGHIQPKAPKAALTEAAAEAQLREDLRPVERMLNERLLVPVSQAQFDALASFAFSIGADAFAASDVLRRLNAGEPVAAACAMDAWRKSAIGGEPSVLDALVRRRAAEKAHFLEVASLVAVPSALVRPTIDHAAAILGSPTAVTELPPAPAAPVDETVRRLAGILAGDPNTAHALRPPPPPPEEDEDVLVLDRPITPPPAPIDMSRLALFGLAGAVLLAIGLVALDRGSALLFALLVTMGAVALVSAGWRLLKDTPLARNWRSAIGL